MKLAGTYHPILYLLDKLSEYLPAVSIKQGVWKDYDGEIYYSIHPTPIRDSLKVKAQEFRSSKSKSEWRKSVDIFSDTVSRQQLSFKDETEMNVLTLYFQSPIDGLNDILLIQFPENAFLKSLNLEFKGINTQEKAILSNLLSSILTTEYQRVVKERDFLTRLETVNLQNIDKIRTLNEHLKSAQHLYSSSIRSVIHHIIHGFEKELNKEIIIDDEVIYRLAKEQLTLEEIQGVIENSIYLSYNTSITSPTLTISNNYLQIDKFTKKTQIAKKVDDIGDKTKLLLDKYEEAALILINKNDTVNGKNVAAALDPPVTPPAITDAVKKNEKKISFLLKQYPDEWENIRKYIRPIANLDNHLRNYRAIS